MRGIRVDVAALWISIGSVIFAGLAWLSAHRANTIALAAPVRALDQELRSQMIEALTSARKDLDEAMSTARYGREVPEVSPTLSDAHNLIERYEQRYLGGQPQRRLMLTRRSLDLAKWQWSDLERAQREVGRAHDAVKHAREHNEARVAEAEVELRKVERRHAALVSQMEREGREGLKSIDEELGYLRAEER